MNLKDKKYLVVGLGKTGISTARFLLSKGAKVALSDSRADVGYKQEVDEFRKTPCVFQNHSQAFVTTAPYMKQWEEAWDVIIVN